LNQEFDFSKILLHLGLNAIIIFAHIHIRKLTYFKTLHRKFWLSFFSGISVAYVFVHIFPELGKAQEYIYNLQFSFIHLLDYHAYLISLAGFLLFYGMEYYARKSYRENIREKKSASVEEHIFWVHSVINISFNFMISYLIFDDEFPSQLGLILFFIAMLTHLMIMDYDSYDYNKELYQRYGRWIYICANLAGLFTAVIFDVSESVFLILFAFLGGGMILNVIKEELPEDKKSNYLGFLIGALVYSAVLILI
jgi:zinc transporter ZupT